MYDQTILLSRTGKRLLKLFDDMEYVMSELYHNEEGISASSEDRR